MAVSTQLIGTVVGEAFGGPAGGAAGAATGNILDRVFAGPGVDKTRQDRVNWTLQMAINGSVLAAEIIMAGPANVSNNEDPMWQQALSQIPGAVLTRAQAATNGQGWWPVGQPDFYTDVNGPTHRQILAEVQATGTPVSTVAPQTTPTVATQQGQQPQMLPTVHTTATAPTPSSSLMLYVIGGLALLFVLVFVLRHHRR